MRLASEAATVKSIARTSCDRDSPPPHLSPHSAGRGRERPPHLSPRFCGERSRAELAGEGYLQSAAALGSPGRTFSTRSLRIDTVPCGAPRGFDTCCASVHDTGTT